MQDYSHEVLNSPPEHIEVAQGRLRLIKSAVDSLDSAINAAFPPETPTTNRTLGNIETTPAVTMPSEVTSIEPAVSPQIEAALRAVEQARAA